MGRIASLRVELLWRFQKKTNNFLLVFRFGDIWLGNRHKPIFLNLVLPRVLKGIMGRIASLRVELLWRFPDKKNDFLPVFRFGDIWLGNRHKPIFLNLVPSQGLERDNGPNCVVAAAIVMAFSKKKTTISCRFSDLAIFGSEIVISQSF